MAGLDEALRRAPWIDPERLGVLGGSYGGFLTSWTVGHTDRFKAACSERAVNCHTSMFGTSDIGHLFNVSEVGGLPWEAPEVYAERSPLTYAKNVDHAAPHHPLRGRSALPDRAGRAALRRAQEAGQGGGASSASPTRTTSSLARASRATGSSASASSSTGSRRRPRAGGRAWGLRAARRPRHRGAAGHRARRRARAGARGRGRGAELSRRSGRRREGGDGDPRARPPRPRDSRRCLPRRRTWRRCWRRSRAASGRPTSW